MSNVTHIELSGRYVECDGCNGRFFVITEKYLICVRCDGRAPVEKIAEVLGWPAWVTCPDCGFKYQSEECPDCAIEALREEIGRLWIQNARLRAHCDLSRVPVEVVERVRQVALDVCSVGGNYTLDARWVAEQLGSPAEKRGKRNDRI